MAYNPLAMYSALDSFENSRSEPAEITLGGSMANKSEQ
jgi:hypothetical protein